MVVFINMTTRSITRSINLYYEDWRVPFIILLLMGVCTILNIIISKQNEKEEKLKDIENETSNSEDSDNEKSFKQTKERKKPDKKISLLVVNLLIPGLISCVMIFAQYFTSSSLLVRWSGNTSSELSLLVLGISFVTAVLHAASIKNFTCLTKNDEIKNRICLLKVELSKFFDE